MLKLLVNSGKNKKTGCSPKFLVKFSPHDSFCSLLKAFSTSCTHTFARSSVVMVWTFPTKRPVTELKCTLVVGDLSTGANWSDHLHHSVEGNSMGGNGGNNIGLGMGNSGPQMKPEPSTMMPGSPGSNILQGGIMPSLSEFSDDGISLGPHHSLAGVKVPDENLTPQQRQHREEQLATLRKMQQMLFPEHHSPGTGDNTTTDLDQVMPDAAELMMNHKNQPVVSQADWQKLQMQFYDERKKKSNNPTQSGGSQNNGRGQGPPPPYHQATRSASVPVAVPSPTPGSPNNTTSNLSLPSPRTCSGLNSPAESKRHPPGPSPPVDSPGPPRSMNLSNPGTPVSTHLSPKKEKQNGNNSVVGEFSPTSNISAPTSQQSPVDSLFCRSLQSLGQQKQSSSNSTPTSKEPNLMPVPSPQQIQYLNTFEGQELTIQKQPNTSLKETNIMSPSLPQKNVEGVLTGGSNSELNSKVSGRTTPLTPVSMELGVSRYTSSPQPTPDKPTARNPSDQRFCSSPQIQDSIATSRFNMISSSPVISNSFMQQQQPKSAPHFIDIPSPNKSCVGDNIKDPVGGNYPCIGPDNIPLNPNGMTRISVGNGNKVSHFDPITSLAQMSQQLTNNVGSSPVNQSGGIIGPSPGMHPGMMPFNSSGSNTMHMMPMNEMGVCQGPGQDMGSPGVGVGVRLGNPQMATHPHAFSPGSVGNGASVNRMPCPSVSPKPNMMQGVYNGPSGPRLVSRAPVPNSYNGANIQVKPSAPNTIQYLPTRPQQGSAGPRGPPSLEFLHRFSNPLSNLDAKVPTHNLQYFPNNYQQNSSGGDVLGNINCGAMGQGPGNVVMRGTLRGGSGGMMRVGVPNMPNMPGFSGNEQMFPNPSGSSCQMFVPSSKGSPLGMGGMAPEASQPLPPSMGQANNFKNSSFIGPTTADPNYAQQFHNFQQQLYATNTRSQLGSQAMGTNQQFFVPK
ncbi:hypothetical protein J6590_065221 [Homalodisca vitripennis]|nr:hypothetical protein J6590_065221 [Homalodisca vitripennis]